MTKIGTDWQRAKHLLEEGAVVAIPTETVYGLAGNAWNEAAVSEIFQVKNRPSFDPLIVHTSSLERAESFVQEIPPAAYQLAKTFMPGPLTLLLPKNEKIPDLVTAGSSLVAVRVPKHPLTLQLLSAIDFPLTAPSANPFGYISPTTAQHVADQLGDQIPYILDGGPCQVGIESTIVGFEDGQGVVYRKGGLAVEAIQDVIGPVQVKAHSSSNPQAPGMLKSHYAPGVPFEVGDLHELWKKHRDKKVGAITFQNPHPEIPLERQIILSPSGDLKEAAQQLFAGMRQLDKQSLEIIIAEWLPEQGLGRAINDRLKRAAAK
jgi:L-threonylcarbamoyladenylate synthase